jgi:hypothetical protein
MKHLLETWFADTHTGRQNADGGSETPLSLDLLYGRRRDDSAQRSGGTQKFPLAIHLTQQPL